MVEQQSAKQVNSSIDRMVECVTKIDFKESYRCMNGVVLGYFGILEVIDINQLGVVRPVLMT